MDASQSSTSQSKRERFTAEQVQIMEHLFQLTPLPTNQQKLDLADQLGISRRRIQVWFQNRRSKAKRQLASASTTHSLDHTPIMEPPTAIEQSSAYNMTSSLRPLARPTAYVYQPTYALDNIFTDMDPDLQQQRYSPAFVFNQTNQPPGRTLPPPPPPPAPVSLYSQGTFTPVYWRTSLFDHSPAPLSVPLANTSVILSHETQQPRRGFLPPPSR
ncbi:hypothetical protein [Absidia glauca]|uniref:Homeobox domain-containing protein n=1 Tax=Absidia glauca TaxID=4829 RepID=A0A163IQ72_ABSGL|nr:hypothetical protein [Absidia glauca]